MCNDCARTWFKYLYYYRIPKEVLKKNEMMTFWWRTLCLVPAGSGCRFHVLLSLSLSPLVAQWQIASWKLSELCRVVRFRWWGLLVPVQLSSSLSPPVCDLRHCPAWRGLWNWWSFCCFGKWGADNATTLTQQHALLLFFHSSLLQPQLFFSFFFGCLSIRSGLASLFFCWILLNPTNSLRSFSFKVACTHWELIKRGIYRLPKNGLRPFWHHESQYTTK